MLSKREKWFGWVTTGIFAAGGILLLNAALPFLNTFLTNLIGVIGKAFAVGGLLALAGIVAVIAMHERTHTLVRAGFAMLARAATSIFVKRWPTEFIEYYAGDYLDGKEKTFDTMRTSVRKQRNVISQIKEANEAEVTDKTEKARTLKNRSYSASTGKWKNEDDRLTFQEFSATIGFKTKSIANQAKQLERMDKYLDILDKYKRAIRFRRNVLRSFVETLKNDYAASMALNQAQDSVAAAFGTDDMKKIFDMSVDFMNNRIAFVNAKVDDFMTANKSVLAEVDLENNVAEDRLLQQLNAWDAGAESIISQTEEEQEALGDPHKLAALLQSNQSQASTVQTQRVDSRRRSYLQ